MKLSEYIGEATAYDKKRELERKEPLSWLKSVSAFANTLGGRLLFGVSDDGELIGLTDAEKDAEDISEAIKTQMDPIPQVDLTIHDEEGRRFIVLEVFKCAETPYYVRHKSSLIAYVRIGNESVRATALDLNRLVLAGSRRSWDSLPSTYKRRDYSFEVLYALYHEKTGLTFAESDFKSFGFVSEGEMLTNAGALFADRTPVRHSRVFCTRWKGLDKAHGLMEALDDEEYSGGLISLLESAKAFIRRNFKTPWRKTADSRLEYPEYPERAYEEAIVNGLIHRDYLIIGSELHIDMYDDRTEIYSPGGMPSGRNVQNLDILDVPSERRNPVIADLFQRMRLMERRGSGFKKIVESYAFESKKRGRVFTPSLRSDSSAFFVVLPNLNYGITINGIPLIGDQENDIESTLTSTKATQKATQKTTQKILEAIAANPKVTRSSLAEIIGITPDGIKAALKSMKDMGLIRRVGPDKGGHWEVEMIQ